MKTVLTFLIDFCHFNLFMFDKNLCPLFMHIRDPYPGPFSVKDEALCDTS